MNALVIEALPTPPMRALPETLQVLLAVIARHIVLAGDIKHLRCRSDFKELVQRVELLGLRQMRQIAGMDDQVRLLLERVDLRDRRLQRAVHIRIGRLA